MVVIGGSGYLGYHVLNYFNADTLSRRNGFDITNPSFMERLKDYRVIIHLAALVDKNEKNHKEVFRVNSEGTRNIANSLREGQILIFTSTKEVHTPEDSYAYSKLIAEKYVEYFSKRNGFRAGIFRLSTTYAPSSNGSTFVNYFTDCIKREKGLSLLMQGEQKRDFLYVDDLSKAFEIFIKSDLEREVWDIGGGKDNSTTMLGLTKIIGKIVGKKPIISFSDGSVKGQIHYITNLTKIEKDLGWKPEINIEEGIRKIV